MKKLSFKIKLVVNRIFFLIFIFKILNPRTALRYLKFFFKRYLLKKPIPALVIFALTYRCQCRCIHCSAGAYSTDHQEMTTQQWKRIIDQVADLGIPRIHFSGGEPLLRKDIVELVEYADKKGILSFLETNGILLSLTIAQKLKQAHIASINVSFDSPEEKTHDKLRDFNGCFAQAKKAINICRELKIPMMVSTYASRRSIESGDLRKLINLAKKMKVSAIRILPPQPSGRWLNKGEEKLNIKEANKINEMLIPSLPLLNRVDLPICPISKYYTVFIAPDGKVQPCAHLPFSFGNINKSSLNSLLKSMADHEMFKKQRTCLISNDQFREEYIKAIKADQSLPISIE